MPPHLRQSTNALRIAGCVILLALTSACSSAINPKPFQDYHDAFTDIQASAEQIFEADRQLAYKSFLEEVKRSDSALADIQLLFDEDEAYAWTLRDESLFVLIQNSQRVFSSLNDAFAEYTALLAQLAGGQMASKAVFDSLATELNANSRSAARAVGLDETDEQAAIFSTAAMAIAKTLIDRQRKAKLQELIEANQPHVEFFAGGAATAMQIAAEDIKTEYNLRFDDIQEEWRESSPDRRPAIVERTLALNEEVAGHLKALETLERGYDTLARKHRDLGTSLEKNAYYSVKELITIAKRLEAQYKELKETEDDG